MNKIQTLRNICFRAQSGRCYYCRQPMWVSDPAAFALKFRLTANRAKWLQATAEHIIARCDQGKIVDGNIVAACRYCNQTRHKHRARSAPSAEAYLQNVRRRLAKGKWHGINLNAIPA